MIMIERLRKKIFWMYIIAIVLLLVDIVGLFIWFRQASTDISFLIIGGILFLASITIFILSAKVNKKYRTYYKTHYIDAMIKSAIPSGQYQPDQGFPEAMIANTGLVVTGNRYHSEDLITGVYNNVEFQRADVLIQNETTNQEGQTETTTYFRGRWMIFESNKYFQADLQIIQKGFSYAQKRTSIFYKKANRRHPIETEDMTFNKEFKCLCQNDQEAFYLLTPVLMQGLMKLAAESDGKIMVGFVNNVIHVAIKTNKDSLEPPIFHKISDKNIREIQREIYAVTSFVEGLRIDNKIFMQTRY
jgi:hypothetical protein